MNRTSSGFCRSNDNSRPPARKPARKRSNAAKCLVRIFGLGELIDDDWNEFGEIFSRLLAMQRAIDSRMPAAHGGGKFAWLAEPDFVSRSSVS